MTVFSAPRGGFFVPASARFWRASVLIFGMSIVASCAGPQPQTVCPGYVHYQHADNQALLAELQGAGSAGFPLPQTHRYLRDYGKQRASLRVICGEKQ